MAKRNRHKSAAARGRFRREKPARRIITPDFQSDIPFEQRHKYRELRYSNGEIVVRSLKKPRPGAPIRSNMLQVTPLAIYKRSPFSLDEIISRRFRIISMNDNWRRWDEELWIKKKIMERRTRLHAQRTRIISGLPSNSS